MPHTICLFQRKYIEGAYNPQGEGRHHRKTAEESPKGHNVIRLKANILCISYGVLAIKVISNGLLLPQRRHKEGAKKGYRMRFSLD